MSPHPASWPRNTLVDGLATATLGALASVGFHSAFGGTRILVVGVVASIVGASLGVVSARRRWHPLVVLALTSAALIVVGGPLVVPGDTFMGLPTADSFAAIVDGAVHGWAQLVTVLVPAGDAGNLLVVPWLCALAATTLSAQLAVRTRRPLLVALPCAAVLAAAVIFGTARPASLLLEGATFSAVALAWASQRHERTRVVLREIRHTRRVVTAVGVLALAGAIGLVVGPALRQVSGRDRYVLRDHMEPVFDARRYPSPLVGFRSYLAETRRDAVVMRVQGLPAGAALRLGVLDAYDGVVWSVGDRSYTSGRFLQVGNRIPTAPLPSATAAHVNVELAALPGVWLPTTGALSAIQWTGPDEARRSAASQHLRVNPATDVAVLTEGDAQRTLKAGDSYQLDALVAPPPDAGKANFDLVAATKLPPLTKIESRTTNELHAIAAKIKGDATSPFEQVKRFEQYFRQGFYSDGGRDGTLEAGPGHSLSRLLDFLQSDTLLGDGEQYASGMALLARTDGIPARVVVGFRPAVTSGSGVVDVKGGDIAAWVEVAFEGVGWVPFDPTPDRTRTIKERPLVAPPKVEPDVVQPDPPVTAPPPPEVDTNTPPPKTPPKPQTTPDGSKGAVLVRYVLVAGAAVGTLSAAVALPALLIVGFKVNRRRRRRRRTNPAASAVGAWEELVDRGRDYGRVIPPRATRPEAAAVLGAPRASLLASQVDRATFGPVEPDREAAEQCWAGAVEGLGELRRDATRMKRLRAAVSLASIRSAKELSNHLSGPRIAGLAGVDGVAAVDGSAANGTVADGHELFHDVATVHRPGSSVGGSL